MRARQANRIVDCCKPLNRVSEPPERAVVTVFKTSLDEVLRSNSRHPRERNNWRLIGRGEGIHWPDLDEDISVEGLLVGRRSGESQQSFRRWLEGRAPSHR